MEGAKILTLPRQKILVIREATARTNLPPRLAVTALAVTSLEQLPVSVSS